MAIPFPARAELNARLAKPGSARRSISTSAVLLAMSRNGRIYSFAIYSLQKWFSVNKNDIFGRVKTSAFYSYHIINNLVVLFIIVALVVILFHNCRRKQEPSEMPARVRVLPYSKLILLPYELAPDTFVAWTESKRKMWRLYSRSHCILIVSYIY